jgi:histone deacetylase complex regulatory component SIN3
VDPYRAAREGRRLRRKAGRTKRATNGHSNAFVSLSILTAPRFNDLLLPSFQTITDLTMCLIFSRLRCLLMNGLDDDWALWSWALFALIDFFFGSTLFLFCSAVFRIDTTGVIKRVKQLFKGHPELTRGFAAFLPKEYKIEVQDDDEGEDMNEPPHGGMGNVAAHQQFAVQQQQAVQAQVQAQQMAAAAAARPTVEVGEEHARLYVKKIKNRFVNQPHIYKNFLEILHTFHREKHSIQEVYTQVAALFRDHPDLLGEFAHFLPDPNAQQPLQVQQAAAQQQHYAQQHHEDHHHISQQHKQPPRGAGSRAGARVMTEPPSRVPSRSQTGSTMAQASMQHGGVGVGVGGAGAGGRNIPSVGSSTRGATAAMTAGGPPPLHASAAGVDGGNKDRSHGTFEELMHFFKLKQVLPQNDYEEFLKLLSMYNADVLTKAELYFMVRDLLRHQDIELLDWFRKFMQVEDLKDEDSHGYLADYDWSTSEKLGPSYRSMPRPWAQWKCSGRQGNAICTEVLNDSWISVPTGTEEGAFKNSRKNQYEELLFKCEDDRFELDLLVEGNASAIRSLETTLASFRTLSPSALATFQLNESDISVLTIKAIRRVYGPRAEEFIKMIMGKPAVAIPVVLARLKAKDTEWNIARREWNVLWKQIFKKNYHKQLDHRSTTFKQEEKKMLTAKALFAELRRASTEQKPNGNAQSGNLEKSEEISPNSANNRADSDDGGIKASSGLNHPIPSGNAMDTSQGTINPLIAPLSTSSSSGTGAVTPGDKTPGLGASSSVGGPQGSPSPQSAAAAAAASQSAVGSPTLSFVIAQPNLFADIRHLLLLTFGSQFQKGDIDKFNTMWNSLICAFFHVDPTLKSLAASGAEGGEYDASTRNATSENIDGVTSTTFATGGSSMDVDGAGFAVKFESGPAVASSVAADGNPSNSLSMATTFVPPSSSTPSIGMMAGTSSASNKPISTELASKPATHHMLFLGNDSFYLLFRYLQILYDRMAEAWMFSEEYPQIHNPPIVEIDPKLPVSETPIALANGTALASSNGVKNEGEEPLSSTTEPQSIIYVDPNPAASAVSRYQAFLKNTEQLLNGTIDQQLFEEKCRHDFGISSFPLFTIDKLLLLLAKQFHAVNSDETSEKLAGLYHYEVSRNMGGFTDAVYLSNCREVLSNDKHAYVFTFDWSNDSQILGITEVDLGHPSFGLEHNEELSNYINKLATNESVLAKKASRLQPHQHTHNSMKMDLSSMSVDASAANGSDSTSNSTNKVNGDEFSPSRDSAASPSVPFLKRNVNGEEESGVNPPVIQNELGVKIVPGTFKLRFVGGTEDSLHRPGRKTEHTASSDKIDLPGLSDNASLPSPMDG